MSNDSDSCVKMRHLCNIIDSEGEACGPTIKCPADSTCTEGQCIKAMKGGDITYKYYIKRQNGGTMLEMGEMLFCHFV